MPVGRLQEVVIDCVDPRRLATFWQQVLGGEIRVESDEWVLVAAPDGGASVSFQRVPEPKAGKNRVHLDVRVDDLAAGDRGSDRGVRRSPCPDPPDSTSSVASR